MAARRTGVAVVNTVIVPAYKASLFVLFHLPLDDDDGVDKGAR